MCGIVGYYPNLLKEESVNILKHMLTRIKHRGPDESGVFISDQVALGSVRLSIIDLDSGTFDTNFNPDTFDSWQTDNNPEMSTAIPMQQDLAKLGQRSRLITIYLVNESDKLKRMILPIYGQGMWSEIYGFIALEADLNGIADITFYQQKETAGIGDKILNPDWQASWKGRKLYDEHHVLQLGSGEVNTTQSSVHQIDAISGATVTVDSVKNLVRYWFGSHGYAKFLNAYRKEVNL